MAVALRTKISLNPSFPKRGTEKRSFFEWRTWDCFSLLPIFVTFPLSQRVIEGDFSRVHIGRISELTLYFDTNRSNASWTSKELILGNGILVPSYAAT